MRIVCYVISALLAGLAGLTLSGYVGIVDNWVGRGFELDSIVAAVMGGLALSGGRGTLAGTFVGFILLGIIGPALVFLNVEASWEKAIQGSIILVAVASDALNLRQRRNVGAGLAAN